MARQTFSLGILGGTERDCLLVVGQASDGETQIYFKVLEYQVKTTIDASNLLNMKESKQLIPVHPSRMAAQPPFRDTLLQGERGGI